jgi:drug/metabolite transporter (DMT)-like permease
MRIPLDNRLLGPVMMIFASLFFALTALFVRMGSESVPVGIMVLARYGFMLLALELLRRFGIIGVHPRNKKLLTIRSGAAGVGGIFYFYAMATIPIADAVVLKYTYPLFALPLAAFYGERTGRGVLVALMLSLAGILVMMNPSGFIPGFGYIWGILCGLSAGIEMVLLRQLRATDDSSTILYFNAVAGVAVSFPFLAQGDISPGAAGCVYTLLVAVFGMLAQISMVYGFRFIKTGSGSVVMALEVVFSALLALMVLGQTPGFWKVVGGVMVISGAAVVSGKGRKESEDIRRKNESGARSQESVQKIV